ncbi:pyridoxal phosphate-dependent aminotransferase [Limnochorda pilosa]|uniref:Aminotransferase class I/II n=1 Tax=Limnochorda pilosa TaxID=1555112 RepID=A0A0K2SH85_LIMPI|nr:aminotransferase class I/II-fold pyridoxal phosphate-dependent enzyme [Limnochorda pilosa]BAS26164.1 aminotransferase class I/II [Limnochorda pilosa]
MPRAAARVAGIAESTIREMTRIAEAHGALNLAQGFPDGNAPPELVEWAVTALRSGENQYSFTWGDPRFRRAIAAKTARFWGWAPDPDSEITVTCGASEAMAASLLAILDPGDELIVFEPFYENYVPLARLAGAEVRYIRLEPPAFRLDVEAVRQVAGPRTRAVVLNTPNNPTGRVFSREELAGLAELCRERDLLLVSDEIYEHFVYGAAVHVPVATLPDMWQRTIAVSGVSKTFQVTGWRLGYVLAPAPLTAAIRKVHDYLTVAAPTPLQVAAARAMDELPASYYQELAHRFARKRDLFVSALQVAGFACSLPEGAYYVMADASRLGARSDWEAARALIRRAGIAAVPGSSFFQGGRRPQSAPLLRFAFCKEDATLAEAARRLASLARPSSPGANERPS